MCHEEVKGWGGVGFWGKGKGWEEWVLRGEGVIKGEIREGKEGLKKTGKGKDEGEQNNEAILVIQERRERRGRERIRKQKRRERNRLTKEEEEE